MNQYSDTDVEQRTFEEARIKLINGTVPTRIVLSIQDLRIPRKIPVVMSPFCLSPFMSGISQSDTMTRTGIPSLYKSSSTSQASSALSANGVEPKRYWICLTWMIISTNWFHAKS